MAKSPGSLSKDASTGAAPEDRRQLTDGIKSAAREIGFDLVGIAPAVGPEGFEHLQHWIKQGFAGELNYIPRREKAYRHPEHVLPRVRSLILLGLNYHTSPAEPGPIESDTKPHSARVSRYAWGEVDYHDHIRAKLKQLADVLHTHRPECRTRGVVDTAPLLERDFARLAGLGWFGKNTMLINKQLGSWLFLAALLTDVDLEPDAPHETSHCGTCTRCLDACPTDAFPEPHVLDARRCLSALNIELRDRPIPHEFRESLGDWLFGCDICQDVCPWNRKAPRTTESAFQPASDLAPADACELLKLDEDQFQNRFGHTPLARPGRAGLLRNAAIVLGNQKSPASLPVLIRSLSDDEPLIRGAAAWAIGRIGGIEALKALQSQMSVEDNADVGSELEYALKQASTRNAPRDR